MAQHPRSKRQASRQTSAAADGSEHLRQLVRLLARLSAREALAGSEAIEDQDAETD